MSDDTVTITAAELEELRLAADRYRWIRQRAVRLQAIPRPTAATISTSVAM
jgi:hypothetical protein